MHQYTGIEFRPIKTSTERLTNNHMSNSMILPRRNFARTPDSDSSDEFFFAARKSGRSSLHSQSEQYPDCVTDLDVSYGSRPRYGSHSGKHEFKFPLSSKQRIKKQSCSCEKLSALSNSLSQKSSTDYVSSTANYAIFSRQHEEPQLKSLIVSESKPRRMAFPPDYADIRQSKMVPKSSSKAFGCPTSSAAILNSKDILQAPPEIVPVSGVPNGSETKLVRPLAFKARTNARRLHSAIQPSHPKHNFLRASASFGGEREQLGDSSVNSTVSGVVNYEITGSAGKNTSEIHDRLPERARNDNERHSHRSRKFTPIQTPPTPPLAEFTDTLEFESRANFSSADPSSSCNTDSLLRSINGFVQQTPSPSDSGVADMETILREKDKEISALRDIMDRNEKAIIQVYEEKISLLTEELKQSRHNLNLTVQAQTHSDKEKVSRMLHLYKLSQDNRVYCKERDQWRLKANQAEERLTQCQLELKTAHRRLAHSQWENCQYVDELAALRDYLPHQLRNRTMKVDRANKFKQNFGATYYCSNTL